MPRVVTPFDAAREISPVGRSVFDAENGKVRMQYMTVPPNIDVFEASPNAYMILDRDLRYVAANRAYLEVTGSRLEDLIGKQVIERFPHDEDDPANENARVLRASFEKVLATGERGVYPIERIAVVPEACS